MILGVFKEFRPGERRVALLPSVAHALMEHVGVGLVVEAGAGAEAGASESDWESAGARISSSAVEVATEAHLHLRVRAPATDDPELLPGEGQLLVCLTSPPSPDPLVEAVVERGGTLMGLERIPRTTRAQSMDVLSSQATVAGYRAALIAATTLPRFFPMLTTAAGTIRPASVLVVGAGVAGLQAMATARRLGASVTGHDIRPAALEQIRSLGARTLESDEGAKTDSTEDEKGYARALDESESDRQARVLAERIGNFDAVITTAQIPGRAAPRIVSRAMVESMKSGSVIVDLAAESGGNCELSKADETVLHGGVRIEAPTNPASSLAHHASSMFSRNVGSLLRHLLDEDSPGADPDDPIRRAITLVQDGIRQDHD